MYHIKIFPKYREDVLTIEVKTWEIVQKFVDFFESETFSGEGVFGTNGFPRVGIKKKDISYYEIIEIG